MRYFLGTKGIKREVNYNDIGRHSPVKSDVRSLKQGDDMKYGKAMKSKVIVFLLIHSPDLTCQAAPVWSDYLALLKHAYNLKQKKDHGAMVLEKTTSHPGTMACVISGVGRWNCFGFGSKSWMMFSQELANLIIGSLGKPVKHDAPIEFDPTV